MFVLPKVSVLTISIFTFVVFETNHMFRITLVFIENFSLIQIFRFWQKHLCASYKRSYLEKLNINLDIKVSILESRPYAILARRVHIYSNSHTKCVSAANDFSPWRAFIQSHAIVAFRHLCFWFSFWRTNCTCFSTLVA